MADQNSMEEGYIQRIGLAVDELFNVIWFNGRPDQTISLHAALDQRKGKRWACILCRILDVMVEHNHCANQFIEGPTGTAAAIRSILALCALFLPFFGLYQLVEYLLFLFGLAG